MGPFAQIKVEDVIALTGAEYLVDGIWKAEFGREIEYQYRAIPYQLIYLLYKYGPAIPNKFFVESIQEVCGTMEGEPNSNQFIKANLAEDAARKLIEEAVLLGLITEVTPNADRRYRIYRVTEEQMKKLYRIRERSACVSAVTAIQAEQPDKDQAGLTEENKSWYRNIMPDMVRRYDAVYQRDKAKLDRLNYLVTASFVVVMSVAIYLTSIIHALATISGGTK